MKAGIVVVIWNKHDKIFRHLNNCEGKLKEVLKAFYVSIRLLFNNERSVCTAYQKYLFIKFPIRYECTKNTEFSNSCCTRLSMGRGLRISKCIMNSLRDGICCKNLPDVWHIRKILCVNKSCTGSWQSNLCACLAFIHGVMRNGTKYWWLCIIIKASDITTKTCLSVSVRPLCKAQKHR